MLTVFVAREAREAIDKYLATEHGDTAGRLFLSKNGGPLSRQNVDRMLKLVAAQANARLPEREHFELSAHKCRDTVLRRVTKEHGVEMAMELAGHTSANYIWRYVRPSEEEKEKALEGLY